MTERAIRGGGHGADPHFNVLEKLRVLVHEAVLRDGLDEGDKEALQRLLEGIGAARFRNEWVF